MEHGLKVSGIGSARRLRAGALGSALGLLIAATAGAAAATVYRWVDDQGRVHYSQGVPPQYRDRALPVGVAAAEATAEPASEARQRAHDNQAAAAAGDTARSAPPAGAAGGAAAPRPAAKRPARTPNEATDCDTWQRLYLESIECFGPFRTVRGGIKPEAFEVCNVVAEPPSHCRMRVP